MSHPKQIDLTEFRDLGILQELNRQFLHPLGLAIFVTVADDGKVLQIGGVYDFRDDPDGVLYANLSYEELKKAERFEILRSTQHAKRQARHRFLVQPLELALGGDK